MRLHLDVEWSGAVAPGATILFIYWTDVINNSLTQCDRRTIVAPIISHQLRPVREHDQSATSSSTASTRLLQQANAQGITVISSSGDSGATDCDSAGLASEGLAVDFPSSSPFVTSAGGTMFSGDVSNSSDLLEHQQRHTHTRFCKRLHPRGRRGTRRRASLGGLGRWRRRWRWCQRLLCQARMAGRHWCSQRSSRDVPDFSLNSGAQHDGYIVCSQRPLAPTVSLISNGNMPIRLWRNLGRCSVPSPAFSPWSNRNSATGGLGNIGPNLYGLAKRRRTSSTTSRRGNNSVSCSQGTPNCPNGGSIGYNAGVGYDQATGLGSIDANHACQQLGVVPFRRAPAAPSAHSSPPPLSPLPALSAPSPPAAFWSFTATVTNASGTSGATPTGTVQFFVDNVPAGAPVALVSGGTASYTLVNNAALALSSGGHNVSCRLLRRCAPTPAPRARCSTNSSDTGIIAPDRHRLPHRAGLLHHALHRQRHRGNRQCCLAPLSLRSRRSTASRARSTSRSSTDTGDVFNTTFSVKPVTITSTSGVTTSFVLTATETTASLTPAASAARLQPSSDGQNALVRRRFRSDAGLSGAACCSTSPPLGSAPRCASVGRCCQLLRVRFQQFDDRRWRWRRWWRRHDHLACAPRHLQRHHYCHLAAVLSTVAVLTFIAESNRRPPGFQRLLSKARTHPGAAFLVTKVTLSAKFCVLR